MPSELVANLKSVYVQRFNSFSPGTLRLALAAWTRWKAWLDKHHPRAKPLPAESITVALFITPLLARAMDEVMQMVPTLLREASYGLGATDFETLLHVVTRQALPGLVTAMLLAFGRGIGDAASVLFTAGYTDRIPVSITDPVATLPLAIFYQINTPLAEVQSRAYASGFILLVIVLSSCTVSRILSRRLTKYCIR